MSDPTATTTAAPAASSKRGAKAPALGHHNLAVVLGALSRPPQVRELPSGERAVELDVTVRVDDGPAEVVPVTWLLAPAALPEWEVGFELAVVGRVRRRFFRAAGATVARTDVLATTVLPARQRAKVVAALEAAWANGPLATDG